MIWQAVTGTWYQPYYTDGTTVYDISNEVAVINNLRTQPQGRPSFNNQTIKMGLNTPVTLTDTKGTLANYSITSSNGISASVNGNNLTAAITSENYDKSITFSRNFKARDVNVIYGSGGYQRVIYLASRRDPSPNFKLNFDLMYADIEVENRILKQVLRLKEMLLSMELHLRLKIQVEMYLKQSQQMDQRQNQKNIQWEQL